MIFSTVCCIKDSVNQPFCPHKLKVNLSIFMMCPLDFTFRMPVDDFINSSQSKLFKSVLNYLCGMPLSIQMKSNPLTP